MKVAWVILLVLAVTVVLWTLCRRRRTIPEVPVTQVIGIDLSTWTDAQLNAVWRATTDELRLAAQSDDAATAARARELLLTEIERRHPRRTAAWLSSPDARPHRRATTLPPPEGRALDRITAGERARSAPVTPRHRAGLILQKG